LCTFILYHLCVLDEKGIKDSWKEFMEKLKNEENERDHSISATVKEGQIVSGSMKLLQH